MPLSTGALEGQPAAEAISISLAFKVSAGIGGVRRLGVEAVGHPRFLVVGRRARRPRARVHLGRQTSETAGQGRIRRAIRTGQAALAGVAC